MADTKPSRFAPAIRAASLSLSLVSFFLLQNVTVLATLAIVGRLGNTALAGLGVSSAVYAVLLALLFGFDTAVQALVSRATGARNAGAAGAVLTEALAISVPVGMALCAFAIFGCGPIIDALSPDRAAAATAEAMLRNASLSFAFYAITIPFNAYWIGSGLPKISLLVSIVSAPIQIALTWFLVFGLGSLRGLGASGAGVALSLATLFGLVLQAAIATRARPITEFFGRPPTKAGLANITAVGWPVSVQQSLLALGGMVSYAIVAKLGVGAVAILNVVMNLLLVPTQIATGVGIACATLVGQSLGGAGVAAARNWGWRMAAVALLPLAAIAIGAPHALLALFISDPQTLSRAVWPVELLGFAISIDAVRIVLSFALRGAGATKVATVIAFVLQWFIQLPLMWLVGITLNQGFNGIAAVTFAVNLAGTLAYAIAWRAERWQTISFFTSAPLEGREAARSVPA